MSDAAKRDTGIIERVGGWQRRYVDGKQRRKARWRWLALGIRDTPPPAFRGLYEEPDWTHDHIGVCCSGGGVRSAAFNLGALQALERDGELQKARYLSAVSGGSYIASAFCMVAKTRDAPGLDPEVFNTKDGLPFATGTPEEQYLRTHLSYLAPDSPAKVYLGLRMTSGLLVNVLLIGLPVLIAGLAIGAIFDGPYEKIADGTISVPPGVRWPIVVVAALAAIAAVADIVWRPGKDDVQTATQTWEVRLFLLAVAGTVALIVVPWLAARAAHYNNADTTVPDAAGDGVIRSAQAALASLIALAGATITHVRGAIRDHQKTIEAAEGKLGKFAKQARNAIVAVVVMLAGPLLLVAVAALGVLISVDSEDKGIELLILAGGILGVMWFFVDLTTVSLHPFYRRRLASAFALRRVKSDGTVTAEERSFDDLVELSKTDVGEGWPMLIVCAAANVSDPGATPPGRGVASFTFSPEAIGGPLTGASPTTRYEALAHNRARDVTLPAAVAMSGAAVSPSMGKLTYRPLTFLLALANIRLGVWVLNPRRINESAGVMATGRNFWHRPRPEYLWKELFGRNRLEDKFLYVTDGGHYENLGLLELLRRGCRTIYCFDAGGGNTSKALGDAIALARTELNIEIDMGEDTEKLVEDDTTRLSKVVCASGTILYPARSPADRVPGRLFYARSLVSDESPWDLRSFQLEDGIFPHDSTFDQFFTDQKFEAYRRLGTCAADQAMAMATAAVPVATDTTTAVIVQAPKYAATGKLKLEFEPDEPPLN
jgi:Patatin-like phospholipase